MPLVKTEKKRSFRHPRIYKYGRGFTWNPPIDFGRYKDFAEGGDDERSETSTLPDTPGRSTGEDSHGSSGEARRDDPPTGGEDDEHPFPETHDQSVAEIVDEIGENLRQLMFINDQLVNIITMKLEGILTQLGL